jgi:hypothetical protein
MWLKTYVHIAAAIGIALTLWGSSLQASRSIEKAKRAAEGPSDRPGVKGGGSVASGAQIGYQGRHPSQWTGLWWGHRLGGTLQEFEVRHFRKVAGAWVLIIVAGVFALVAELVDLYGDLPPGC